eukprot:394562_1
MGNSLAFDYMSELELRLQGHFVPPNHYNKLTNSNLNKISSQEPQHMVHNDRRWRRSMNSFEIDQCSRCSGSVGSVAGINMNAPMNPNHTPMSSVGSVQAMTPQTSISNPPNTNDIADNKRKNVKTGAAFDKAKKLLLSKKKHKKNMIQQQQQMQQQEMMMQQQQQMQIRQQVPYPPLYGQYHQYPPQPSTRNIPSKDKQMSGERRLLTHIIFKIVQVYIWNERKWKIVFQFETICIS